MIISPRLFTTPSSRIRTETQRPSRKNQKIRRPQCPGALRILQEPLENCTRILIGVKFLRASVKLKIAISLMIFSRTGLIRSNSKRWWGFSTKASHRTSPFHFRICSASSGAALRCNSPLFRIASLSMSRRRRNLYISVSSKTRLRRLRSFRKLRRELIP